MGSFYQFAEISDRLAATTKKLVKRSLISAWLAALAPDDAARAALYFAGQPFPETDTRSLNLGGAVLTKAIAELSGATGPAMHAAYRRHGDLGAAAFDLLQLHAPVLATLTLGEVEEALDQIAAARGPEAKLRITLELLRQATPLEAKYLIKLALGDMRTGVRQSLIEDAIAVAYSSEPAAVRRAVMLVGSLPEVVRMAAARTLENARMRLFHPLGFMLASPVASVEEAIERFTRKANPARAEAGCEAEAAEEAEQPQEDAPAIADAPLDAQLEDKYDGIRCQLHCGDASQRGRVALFSRTRENMTSSFPELVAAFAGISEPVILDGEILAWTLEQQRALPFSALQQRIGRKRLTAKMLRETPVVFMAFDVLSRGGRLLLDHPLAERRALLEDFIAANLPSTASGYEIDPPQGQSALFVDNSDAFPRLVLAPATALHNGEQLDRAYTAARARGNEGVMLKARNSLYQPGRRGLAWLKLKRELATLDVVVTAAEYGHGRRAAVLSDYTFAVRDGDRLRNVGKAYSGLTDGEIAELTQAFLDQTIEDQGHLRIVEPTVVLEVAFNNVMRSERHNSGFALRFPRILRIRTDKPVDEIDTLARVEEIYASQPDKPVEE